MDAEVLLQAALLAYVLAQFADALLKPAIEIINLLLRAKVENDKAKAAEMQRQAIALLIDRWPLYATMLIMGSIAWFSGLNLLATLIKPHALGQLLTALGIGLGPSFIHDLKPKDDVVTTHKYDLSVVNIPEEESPRYYDMLHPQR